MAAKPETNYITKIHRQTDKYQNPKIYHQKMNMMAMCSNGIPDVYYESKGGKELFVEYKFITRCESIRKIPMRKLSPAQLIWLERHIENGHECAVIFGCEDGKGFILHNKEILKQPKLSKLVYKTPKEIAEFIASIVIA